MGSDFIASILIKCHKTRAPERFLQVGFLFPKIFKMKPVVPSSPDMAPVEMEQAWKNLASSVAVRLASPNEGICPTDIEQQEVKCRCAIFFFFFKKLFN